MSVTTNKWLKFFCDAGLPSNVATNYAIIFTNHRIQNDMLCDLTKEILYDMGIKTMGDVIAILRHAKSVDHNTTRDQLLGTDPTQDQHNPHTANPRLTFPAAKQSTKPIVSQLKTNQTRDSTQNSNIISLKRSANTSGLVSTNPKIKRIAVSEEDINPLNNGSHKVLGVESHNSFAKTSVFSRLGVDKNADKSNSIFARLGNTSGLDSVNPKRRVTMSGNSINTTLDNNNIIYLNNNNVNNSSGNTRSTNLFVRKTISPKKTILAPNSGGMRSTQIETVSLKDRLGMNTTSNSKIISTNRLVVNRSLNSNLSSNRLSTSPAVAQAKRIAMKRATDSMNKKTISLRKNIFDRLGPISL